MELKNIKQKLQSNNNSNETRIYFGKNISSYLFNGQLNSTEFNLIESIFKKSCKLESIPYKLFTEYCYDTYTYHTNTKIDKLFSYQMIQSHYISNYKSFDCKINHINLQNHNTFAFNSQHQYNHIQPFLEATLKINDNISIKLRKNIYSYDYASPISSYQVFIIYTHPNTPNNKDINLIAKIILDVLT